MFKKLHLLLFPLVLSVTEAPSAALLNVATDTLTFSYKSNGLGKLGQPTPQTLTDISSLTFQPDSFQIDASDDDAKLHRTFKVDVRASEGYLISGFEIRQEGEYAVVDDGKIGIKTKVRVIDHSNPGQNFKLSGGEKFKSEGSDSWALALASDSTFSQGSSWISLFITEDLTVKGNQESSGSWASLLSLALNVKTISIADAPGGQPVPIPPALLVFASGLLGLSGFARVRR